MTSVPFPRLIDVEARPVAQNGQTVVFLCNRNRMSDQGLCVPASLAVVLELLDGRRSLEDVHREAMLRVGVRLELAVIEELIHALDGIYVLDGERYRKRKRELEDAFVQSAVREAVCAGGVYAGESGRLRDELDSIYTMRGGAGLPKRSARRDGGPRMILSPHIDYRRGRHSFGWGFQEIAERTEATTFVILATSHYSLRRYVLTRKSFRTPLGLVASNQRFLDSLERDLGKLHYEDEIAHKPEHSIELQVVLLQHALGERHEFSIVPILVGSFGDYIDERREPASCDTTRRMIDAIRTAEQSCGERVCYIVSGDLAHVGPKFGDVWRVDGARSQWCREKDQELLTTVQAASPEKLFGAMEADGDERRICGFPPLYVGLSAARPSSGRLLCYDQFVDRGGFEIVSYASMAFD